MGRIKDDARVLSFRVEVCVYFLGGKGGEFSWDILNVNLVKYANGIYR